MKVRLGWMGCSSEINEKDVERVESLGFKLVKLSEPTVFPGVVRTHKISGDEVEIELQSIEQFFAIVKAMGSCVVQDHSVRSPANGFSPSETYDGITIQMVTDYF